MDLRKQLTVFLISSGEPDYAAALKALREQDCQFTLREIKNVSPMNVAFQQMIDQCKTPWYIQVDADMILRKSAVREMYQAIQKPRFQHQSEVIEQSKVAFLTFLLRDVHLGINIFGVKIYNHQIMRHYPYTESYSCEVDQAARLRADGFRHLDIGAEYAATPKVHSSVMGQHSPTWTPERIFNRYKRLYQKYRRFGYHWLKPLPNSILKRLSTDMTGLEKWAFMGMVAGLTGPLEASKEADSKAGDEDFERLKSLVGG